MDVLARRTLIATGANPDPRLDYVVELEGSVAARGNTVPIAISLRYIPDKDILEPASFSRYLEALASIDWPSLEELAVTLLSDVNNEVVARWVHVSLSTPASQGLDSHSVMIEDRQPKWDNSHILSRLKKL
jgi:7-cyano-7-deazaguanine reductase